MHSRHRRTIVLFAFVLAATALLVGTGGYSSVSADRGVHIVVADDAEAFLGLKVLQTNGDVNEPFALLGLSDQFGSGTEIDVDRVEIVSTDAPVEITATPDVLPGTVRVECVDTTGGEAVDVEVRIEVSGDGVSVEKTKTMSVTCTAATSTTTTTTATSATTTTTTTG